MRRACLICGRPSVEGRSRCSKHGFSSRKGPSPYDAHHQDLAKLALKGATTCWICGGGPRLNDPFQADHVVPLSLGGTATLDNLRPAHRTCNIRKGGANRRLTRKV